MGSYFYFYYEKSPSFLQWYGFESLKTSGAHSVIKYGNYMIVNLLDQRCRSGHKMKEDLAMTEKEKLESYIAMCKCCMLAQAMKSCPLCRFNIGLAEEVMLGDAIPVLINAQTPMFIAVE